MKVILISRASDKSIDVELSNGAIGNFDTIHQASTWALSCGATRQDFETVLSNCSTSRGELRSCIGVLLN